MEKPVWRKKTGLIPVIQTVQRIDAIQVDPILIPSSFSIKKKKKGGSARSARWDFRFCIMP